MIRRKIGVDLMEELDLKATWKCSLSPWKEIVKAKVFFFPGKMLVTSWGMIPKFCSGKNG